MSFDEKQYRGALGRFATGVCVVSAVSADNRPIGMTINSFSSVSLQPSLIQWSLKSQSLCFPLFSQLDVYSISVLSEQQVDISRRYAKAGDHIMRRDDYDLSADGIPFIRNSLAHFECRTWGRMEAGDHQIILGRVERFSSHMDGRPLVFYQGSYRPLAVA